MNKTRITVVGAGYVGMSIAVLLAKDHDVILLDTDPSRIDMINNKKSTINDVDITKALEENSLNISGTTEKMTAYNQTDFVVVATPTNYDTNTNSFDTSSVDEVIKDALSHNQDIPIVIKSTLPIGHTQFLQEKFKTKNILFSPEFLREGHALYDNLHPSRIIIGSKLDVGKKFADLLVKAAYKNDVKILYMNSTEAEAVKLFANTYLAMRVSFFNELDSFALAKDLDSEKIIKGVCLDDRISMTYNNPSFGYGGYCLPKDTKQLLANFKRDEVPQTLIKAIVESNEKRKDFIASKILNLKPNNIGIYRLVMKHKSDNFRSSAVQGIIDRIKSEGVNIFIYEPELNEDSFFGSEVIEDLQYFKKNSDIIIANRVDKFLNDVAEKCFSRDIFSEN
jgi:UDPglucose 6-dehydrogenase